MGKRKMRHSAVVFVFALDRPGELLAVESRGKEGRNGYGVPGGGDEPFETPGETARRELREETGLDPSHLWYAFSLPCGETLCHAYTAVAPRGFEPASSAEGRALWLRREALLGAEARFPEWNAVALAAVDYVMNHGAGGCEGGNPIDGRSPV